MKSSEQAAVQAALYFHPVEATAAKLRALAPVLILCSIPLIAQKPAANSSAVPRDNKSDRQEIQEQQVSFPTDDGGVIYADVYGSGDRGLVLAHGGQFNKESWKPQAQYFAKTGFRVLAFDFRGFGQSHGPGDSDLDTAPMKLDVLAAVHYLRETGAKTVDVVGASFGGNAAAGASIASQPGEIDRLVLLAAEPGSPAEKIKSPLLIIVARDEARDGATRLSRIRPWFDKAPQPKELLVLNGSAHAQFLFQTDQRDRVLEEILRFVSTPKPSSDPKIR